MVLHLDSEQIACRFKRSLKTYESGALVQKDVGTQLLALAGAYSEIRWNRVLEIGCCTGLMTEALCQQQNIDTLFLNDLVPDFCISTARRVQQNVREIILIPGDIEKVELPEMLDVIISSSTFQWLVDLPHCFRRFAASLHEGGFLVFSIFGPGTMAEMKVLTGVGLKYSSEEQLKNALHPSFRIIEMKNSLQKLYFSTPRDVLRHIQQTGVSGVTKYKWTPKTLRVFEARYREQFAEQQGVPVSYSSIFIIAQKL